MKERGLIPTIHSFVGYIAGSLFAEATSKVTPPVTKETLLQYLESLKDYNFRGINVSFNPKTKNLINDTWIKTLDDKWIKYK